MSTEPERVWTAPPDRSPSLLIRAIWFIFIGWWLSAVAIGVAYFLCAIIIGIPLAFMIFNQLPLILTLRPRSPGTGRRRHPGAAPAVAAGRLVHASSAGGSARSTWPSPGACA